MAKPIEARKPEQGVCFPQGMTGSRLFANLLGEAAAAFPGAFGALHLPRGREFRKGYAELVTQFEALRVASSSRAQIALFLAQQQLELFRFREGDVEKPLLDAFAADAAPFTLVRGELAPVIQPVVEVPYLGKRYRGAEVAQLARDFLARHGATNAAVRALEWTAARGGPEGVIDLSGHSFAVLGASAEIAPTELLIRGGARVLWIDIKEPPKPLQRANVQWVAGGADLLLAPARIAKTIEAFAEGQPVHWIACAYAPGRGREWRLAVAMNAIAQQLHAPLASMMMLLSPTSPADCEPEDLRASEERKKKATLWQRALATSGLLGLMHRSIGPASVCRSVVKIQGTTYQAAQYLGKRISAEAFAIYGPALDAKKPSPLLVSANVAPITRTRSLKHPLFEAAFLGAPLFGVETFESETTRALGFLLALHDLLSPQSPAARQRDSANPGDLFRQHIHGGIFGLPWAFDASVSVAALLGLGKRPAILLKLFS